MRFLLKGAMTFQQLMNEVLRGLTGFVCFMSIDDIVCYGHNLAGSISSLQQIFKRHGKHDPLLYVKNAHYYIIT